MTVPALAARQIATHHSLYRLNNWLATLAAEADELAEQGDKRALAYGLAELREFRRNVADLEHHIEGHVAKLMGQAVEVLDDDELVLERHSGAKRKDVKWDRILSALKTLSAVDANGEVVSDAERFERFAAAIEAVAPLTSSVPPRAGAMRDRGLNPDDYCESSPGRVSVKVDVKKEEE